MRREAGKGDKRRPEDTEAYEDGYDRIWGKKKRLSDSEQFDKAIMKNEYYDLESDVPNED